jgi:hypothetical protein
MKELGSDNKVEGIKSTALERGKQVENAYFGRALRPNMVYQTVIVRLATLRGTKFDMKPRYLLWF